MDKHIAVLEAIRANGFDFGFENDDYAALDAAIALMRGQSEDFVRGVNAERREDMSPTGRLRLNAEDDGDMVVTVIDERGSIATVEFCNSGGKSPQTLDALRRLSVAMTEDAASRPLHILPKDPADEQ